MLPILNPPPSSLPIPYLWVVPVHQPQVSSIVHRTWTGDSFIYDIIHVSMPFSQIIPPSPCPTESKRLFYTSVSFFVWLISLSIIFSRSVYFASDSEFHSFYGWVILLCVFVIYTCHIFFIHSSVDGHLNCCDFLALVNSTTMNIHTQVSEFYFQSLGVYT